MWLVNSLKPVLPLQCQKLALRSQTQRTALRRLLILGVAADSAPPQAGRGRANSPHPPAAQPTGQTGPRGSRPPGLPAQTAVHGPLLLRRAHKQLLCDFYELTMGNGYFQTGLADRICYFDVFYRSVPDRAASPSRRAWPRWWSTSRTCALTRRTSPTSGPRAALPRSFWTICGPSASPATSGPCPRAPHLPRGAHPHRAGPRHQAQFIETFLLLSLNHQSLIATKSNRIVRAAEGRPVADSAPAGPRAPTALCWAPGPATSPAAPPPPAPWPTSTTAPPPPAPWPTPGCRCSPTSTPPSRPTASSIPTTPPCWWTPITCSRNPACPTPSGPSKRCPGPRASPSAASAWTPATSPTCPGRPGRCWTRRAHQLQDLGLQRPGRVHHPGPGAPGARSTPSAWASGSSPPALSRCSAGCTSWRPSRTRGQHHPQDQDQRERRQDHHPPLQKGLPHLLQGHGARRRPTSSASTTTRSLDFTQPLELFDPDATWKRKTYTDYEARELMVPIFLNGKLVYQVPDLQASRAYCQRQVDSLWDEVKRFENPQSCLIALPVLI